MTAVAFGIAFPAVFFVLAAAHAIEEHAAFTMAKWSGVGLLGFYGFGAALIGAFLVALKALLH